MTPNPEQSITVEQVVQQLQAGNSMPAELLEVFSEEAEDHLRTIYDGLDRLQHESANAEALADVRRASHTLKGAAGAVGMQSATKLAHRMEDLLDRLAERQESVTAGQLKLLFATADQLQGLTSDDLDIAEVAQQIVGLYQEYSVELGESTEQKTMDSGAEDRLDAVDSNSSMLEELDRGTPDEDESSSSAIAAPLGSQSAPAGKAPTQYLRVPLDRLDRLVNLLGELVVNRSEFQQRMGDFEARIEDMQSARERLREVATQVETQQAMVHKGPGQGQANKPKGSLDKIFRNHAIGTADSDRQGEFDLLEFEQYSDTHLLEHTLAEADKDVEIMSGEFRKVRSAFEFLLRRQRQLVGDAQNGLMRIRMVPLNGIASRLERTLRIVSSKVERQVSLQVDGGELELDKTVLDAITDPLMHLIRNAVDHGIENAEARAAAGKPETACLRIQAFHQGTQITLRISDDGAGINAESVRQKAIEKGLIEANQELSDDELHALIFRPGFSTASQLTDISGRGVGMDVVGEAISRLKGTIRVDSKPGIGTTFTIQLPTAMGVSRAVMIESGGSTFMIPMKAIGQFLQFDPSAVIHEESSTAEGQSLKVAVGDQDIPVVSLASHLRLNSKSEPFERACPMLIVDNGESQVAVTIDKVLGCREIVVKPLGNHLQRIPGIAGVTIIGDGTVIPVLEPSELGTNGAKGLMFLSQGNDFSSPTTRPNLAMVIDDSISVRRVTENVLRYSGWDVVTAKDGIDALEKLAGLVTAPDVFLCDMEMPRMDGLELIRQIREQSEFELTPIVMVTSRSSEKHRQKAFEAGATDFVVKPFNDKHLLDLATQLIETSRETIAV